MTTTAPASIEELDGPPDVLVFVRANRRAADAAEAAVLYGAVTWAEQHPPESISLAATWMSPAGDTGLPLAGPGGAAGRGVLHRRVRDRDRSLHRLRTRADRRRRRAEVPPASRLARIRSGELAVWKARRIYQSTIGLSMEAATFVDAQVTAFAHKIGIAALERLVAEAIARFMPDTARENAEKAADGRHVTLPPRTGLLRRHRVRGGRARPRRRSRVTRS